MKEIMHVTYSHSEYADVLIPSLHRLNKFGSSNLFNNVVFVDDEDCIDHMDHMMQLDMVPYGNLQGYRNRIVDCMEVLERVHDFDHVLFLHEDMLLYDHVDEDLIVRAVEILDTTDFSFVRLIKTGETTSIKHSPNFFIYPSSSRFLFAIQPTIWKKDVFTDLHKNCKGETIWDFEVQGSAYLRSKGVRGLYIHTDGKKRGNAHWDSTVYPYIATAVVKGRWLTSEYPQELQELFDEFDIDKSVRGER